VGARRPNPKLVKIHRSYTVEEAATVCGVHRNTVRQWLKGGLTAIDKRHPTMVQGATLAKYLRSRRASKKRPCQPGQMYCMRCHEPKRPAEQRVSYSPITVTFGNLIGVCPVCQTRMFRRVSLAKLAQVIGTLRISGSQAQEHIGESAEPSVNSDFNDEAETHANAPC
jgi:hypothetical protein